MTRFFGDLDPAALSALLKEVGAEPYRARQLTEAYYQGTTDTSDLTTLPIPIREALHPRIALNSLNLIKTVGSATDAQKFLFSLYDGNAVESVLLFERTRITACLSTQVGCAAGCTFCASGLDGLVRNLSATEIVDQLLQMLSAAGAKRRIDHVVLMGMGEPLLNYRATLQAIRRLNARDGCNIGGRKITVSTVGIPQRIDDLAREQLQINLAISLHAADDTLRSQLVPFAKRYPLSAILASARNYFEATGRQITFEYVLLRGVNDADEDARKLSALLKGMHSLVNLIPYNPVDGIEYEAPAPERSEAFLAILKADRVAATIRKEKGQADAAACGQLRLTSRAD